MKIYEYIKKLFSIKMGKNKRIIAMVIYALIMFLAIQSQMGIFTFILLFAILPIGIYLFVKSIFPKK